MNKSKFSIFAILLAVMFVFAGCTKASNATLEQCYALYDGIIAKYGTSEETEKIKVFNEDGYVDLYSNSSYSTNLYNNISYIETDGSVSILNTLRKNAEYQALMHGASQLFLEWRVSNPLGEVPQEAISKLYEAIDGLDKIAKNVYGSKRSLENTLDFVDNVNSPALKSSLDEYLKNYCDLINKYIKISSAYETIYETLYMESPTQEVIILNDMDIKKLVLNSEVYLSKYYYLKNVVLTKSFTTRFGFEKVYDSKTESFVNNENYDELFSKFLEIKEKDSSIDAGQTDDKISYYNAGLKKLQSFKMGVKNFEKAVDMVVNNKDKSGEYQKFIDDFGLEVQNYQNYILINIIN